MYSSHDKEKLLEAFTSEKCQEEPVTPEKITGSCFITT
jgi:hypothetical protein